MKQRIQALCKAQGKSANQLEIDLGFGKGYIAKLDNSDPSVGKIRKIAEYLNCSVDYLIYGTESAFSDESATLVEKIRHDSLLSEALRTYFMLSDKKKRHIIETIYLFNEGA